MLLALRFLLELALLAAYLTASVALLPAPGGWVAGLLAVAGVATVWGVLLSPRRPVRWPLAARLTVELALFLGASVLLSAAGHPAFGATLMALELLVLGLLRGPDRHAP